MGTVYLAQTIDLGDVVAVKVIAAGPSHDTRFRERFERECALAASLHHPNVVTTIASGETEGHLYLAMEYVAGSDLREILRAEGPLDPGRALRLVAQVAEALDAAHKLGLVHRDVKPGNILVTEGDGEERALVCDFGLARHVSSPSSLTGDRGFVGTIDYVPPEQIQGHQVDRRSDLYSLGCVLFECLVGAKPFERESELSVVFAHLNDPPPRPTEFRSELPAAWDEFFARALAKEPSERFGSGHDFVNAARAASLGKRWQSRGVRRLVIAGVVGVLVGAAVASGLALESGSPAVAKRSQPAITESAIAGLTLGHRASYYRNRLGGARSRTLGRVGYPYLYFRRPAVAVYFPRGVSAAHIITTWNKSSRTAAGIGPCSTLTQAKEAYGRRWRPSSQGVRLGDHYSAYVVGNDLIFETRNGVTISAVGLYEGDPYDTGHGSPQAYANYVTQSETACE